MLTRPWNVFLRSRIERMLTEKESVIDIGGGLRALSGRGNRQDPRRAWAIPFIEKTSYKILDPIPDFNPDIVGDIHHLPFEDNSQDAYICIAVLEHVEDPIRAVSEMYRTLKPGGHCFIYVPFLYYYHAEVGYYKDFWRFTKDTANTLTRAFSSSEIVSVRGAIETWVRISPLGRFSILGDIAYVLDCLTGKLATTQTSGYFIFAVK